MFNVSIHISPYDLCHRCCDKTLNMISSSPPPTLPPINIQIHRQKNLSEIITYSQMVIKINVKLCHCNRMGDFKYEVKESHTVFSISMHSYFQHENCPTAVLFYCV